MIEAPIDEFHVFSLEGLVYFTPEHAHEVTVASLVLPLHSLLLLCLLVWILVSLAVLVIEARIHKRLEALSLSLGERAHHL